MYKEILIVAVSLFLQKQIANCSMYKDDYFLMENCENRVPFNYSIISRNLIPRDRDLDLHCAILCLETLLCRTYVLSWNTNQCILSWQSPESCEQMEIWDNSVMYKVS